MNDFDPHMPQVDIVQDIDDVIAKARELAAKCDESGRSPIVVTPSHRLLFPLGSVPPNSKSDTEVRQVEALVPAIPPLNITVIALNTVETLLHGGWKRCIPFAGYLLGMAYIGHNVIVTEGHPSVLAAACKKADLLVVDGGMVPFLQPDWPEVARRSGSIHRVLIFERNGSIKQLVSNPAGQTGERSNQGNVSGKSVDETNAIARPAQMKKPWWQFW